MKPLLRSIIFAIIFLYISYNKAEAQGCVAIRSTGGLCSMDEHPDSANLNASTWLFNTNTRYYRSFRHFIGTEEQKQRIAQGTNVINHSYTQDLTLTRLFNSRWSLSADVPILANSRSSLYEHGNVSRNSTHSYGLGDIRVAGYAWLFNPLKATKGNIQLGLGIKFATGAYNYQDYFYNVGTGGARRLGPVDQSIQLGDGGTGFTGELNTYYNFSHKFGFYGNFFYLLSPREQNGVSTARGGTASASAVANTSDIMSVPDQMMIRAGFSYEVKRFVFMAGVRDECLPSRDLIGGSAGFRRPGYIISAEPNVTYRYKNFSIYADVPVALVRNRTISFADHITTELTGNPAHGDAAFADYVINLGVTFRLR